MIRSFVVYCVSLLVFVAFFGCQVSDKYSAQHATISKLDDLGKIAQAMPRSELLRVSSLDDLVNPMISQGSISRFDKDYMMSDGWNARFDFHIDKYPNDTARITISSTGHFPPKLGKAVLHIDVSPVVAVTREWK